MRFGLVAQFLPVVVLNGLVTSGCGDDGGSGAKSPAAQACEDTADAVAKAAERCGGSYQANYDAFVQAAVGGNCNNTVSVRDRAALYDTCIPSFATISCADLTAGNIDATCRDQLLHL